MNTRYVAEIHSEEIMIYVYRTAGICGPGQSAPLPKTLEAADEWLRTQGFSRTGAWETGNNYAGLMLSAELVEL